MAEPKSFEDYLYEWDVLQARIEVEKASLKKLTEKELQMRKAIVEAVKQTVSLKEGMNNIPLPGDRKLKITRGVERKVLDDKFDEVRAEFMKLNDRPVAFEALFKTKRELIKSVWNTLSPEALLVVSRVLDTKDSAPVMELVK